MSKEGFKKPYHNYIEDWTTFRANSDEKQVIAEWLLSQNAWPKKNPFSITDFGCGDGKVAAQVILSAPRDGNHARSIALVDPDQRFLEAACQHLRDVLPPNRENHCELASYQHRVGSAPAKCFESDVLLLIHVVYLMPTSEFRGLLRKVKPGSALYIILDHPKSVFSQLWKETAPKYLARVEKTHSLIAELSATEFHVRRSLPEQLISRFRKSALDDHLIGPRLISMLCYDDKLDIGRDERFKTLFWNIVNKQSNSHVNCRSVGYEIIRKIE